MEANNSQAQEAQGAIRVPGERLVPHLQQQINNLSLERAALAARCDMLAEENEKLQQTIDELGKIKADAAKGAS